MKLSKRAEKLRDELADADSYNQWADKQPDKNNYMHTYIRGFDAGNEAARLEAKVLETNANDARVELAAIIDNPNQEVTADEIAEELTYADRRCIAHAFNLLRDALKKYRGEQ